MAISITHFSVHAMVLAPYKMLIKIAPQIF